MQNCAANTGLCKSTGGSLFTIFTLRTLKLQSGMDKGVKICAWHWPLFTLKETLIKLQRRLDQTTSAFIVFLKSTEWRLANGLQFGACSGSKKKRPLRVIARGNCKHPECQCVRFPRCCLSANTRPRQSLSWKLRALSCHNNNQSTWSHTGRSVWTENQHTDEYLD